MPDNLQLVSVEKDVNTFFYNWNVRPNIISTYIVFKGYSFLIA